MRTLLAPIASLLGGVALLLLGHGLLNTLLTLRGVAEGYSTGLLGLLMSVYFLGYLGGTWVAPSLIRRVGHIRAFACCAALAAIAAVLHVLLVNPLVWLLLRLIYGVALVTLYMVTESWLNAQVSGEQRGQTFALYMLVNLGSLAIAQQLLHLGDPLTFTLFAWAGIFICSGLIPITLTRQTQPTLPETPSSTDIKQLAKIAPLPLLAAALSGLALGGFWGLAPVYASQIGYDAAGVGLLMSVTILGGALLQWPIGRFSDTHDRRFVLIAVSVLAAGLAVLLDFLPAGKLQLLLMFVWGGLSFSVYSVAVAQMTDQLYPDEILSGSSGLLLANGLGSAIGPLAASAVMFVLGPQGLPLYFAAMFTLLVFFAVYRSYKVTDLITGPPGHFTPMLRTSHAVFELLPDAPETEQSAAQLNAADH